MLTTRCSRFLLGLLAVLLFTLPAAQARELRDKYQARLSREDHENSNGEGLGSAAAIIRQDRANFHKYGMQDDEDENDEFFASAKNRALLERYLERGECSRSTERAIVRGTPLIEVRVYSDDDGDDYIVVKILEE